MLRTTTILCVAVGVIGMAATPAWPAPAGSQPTDFSAQENKKKAGQNKPAQNKAPRVQQRAVNNNQNVNVNRNIRRNVVGPAGPKVFSSPAGSGPKGFAISGPKGVSAARFKLGPGKAGPAFAKPANFKFVKIGNKVAPVWKSGPKKIWWGGGWKTFAPFAALGVVVIGGAYYYPDAYLTVARPYCAGITPDGCRLNWQQVEFEGGGGSEWQCVEFCPRPGLPPPARTVALVAPPPITQGTCEMDIYSEPNFGGTNATATDEQPDLSANGWQNEVASVQVKSGTWDFFSDQQFTGETMRLPPGPYADLGPQWTKHSGSFMCVQP